MNNKTLLWIIGILVVINIATLSTLWFNKPKDRGFDRERRSNYKEHFLKRSLNLSDQQDEELKDLRKEHFAEIRNLKEEENQLKSQFIDYAFEDVPDSVNIEEMRTQLGNLIIQQEKLRARHFKEVAKKLDSEQLKKFKKMTKKYLKRELRKRKKQRRKNRK